MSRPVARWDAFLERQQLSGRGVDLILPPPTLDVSGEGFDRRVDPVRGRLLGPEDAEVLRRVVRVRVLRLPPFAPLLPRHAPVLGGRLRRRARRVWAIVPMWIRRTLGSGSGAAVSPWGRVEKLDAELSMPNAASSSSSSQFWRSTWRGGVPPPSFASS